MSDKSYTQGQQDAAQNKGAANTHGQNWQAKQNYDAGYAQQQQKQNQNKQGQK